LKLLLLTLIEQTELRRVRRIIVCDNGSRDGGPTFLHQLEAAVPQVAVVYRHHGLSHARGMRAALRTRAALEAASATEPATAARTNLLLFCDTDVIFRNPTTLAALGELFVDGQTAAAGELRGDLYPYPEAQASFLAVRADWCARRETLPWVNHGAPSYWLQRSLWRAGGRIQHFPSNQGGFILHRGRAAVAAVAAEAPLDSYATIRSTAPHFMGVPGGAGIWAAAEARHAQLLRPEGEAELLGVLASALRAKD
jgi:glycosyltransferase involved in cell wall biosynthesis